MIVKVERKGVGIGAWVGLDDIITEDAVLGMKVVV